MWGTFCGMVRASVDRFVPKLLINKKQNKKFKSKDVRKLRAKKTKVMGKKEN